MSELKAALEDDSTPSNQDTVSEEDDNLSDAESHTGSERDAASEAGSETPSLSERSSQRASRSASNTPTNTRSTRSRDNPDFVAKQKSFMAKVQAATAGSEAVMVRPETPGKRKRDSNTFTPATKKRKLGKTDNNGQDYQNDNYCWECHREGVFICCEMCPRVFHLKCAGMEKEPEEDWACSECHAVMQAENTENRSRSMQLISVEQLCTLLKYALNRLKTMAGMEPFTKPVDTTEFPTYEDIVVHPVDFTSLERNIKRKFYGSTEAFSSDARWIVHNSVIFNGANSKVSSMARSLVKILKQEMSEIETCPDCYMNAHQNPKSWFTEVCRSAHPLIWARLKGFPFWPAKAVKWKDGNVDVRFFGRHDRSWVPIKECFLFSEQMPTPLKNRNKTLEACLQEVNEHIAKLREKFGKFKYAPHRIQFNPSDPDQIKIMLPNYKGPVPQRMRPQSRALSRLSGHSDDETSSIASTDSASGFRRGRRESGTSSATQGTETEPEVPSQTIEARHRNSVRKTPSEEAEFSQEEKDQTIKEERDSEDEGLTLNAASLCKPKVEVKEEEQEDEEMEDCGKYPGQKSSAENSDMEDDDEEEEREEEHRQEEDDTSSLVNGKSPAIKNEPEGSEEEAEGEEGGGSREKSEGGGDGGGGGGSSDGEDEEMATPASNKDDNEDETEETTKKDIKKEREEEDKDNKGDNKEEEEDEEEEEEEEEEEDEDEDEDEEEDEQARKEESQEDKKTLNSPTLPENGVKMEINMKSSEEPLRVQIIKAEKVEDSCSSSDYATESERAASRESVIKVEVKKESNQEEPSESIEMRETIEGDKSSERVVSKFDENSDSSDSKNLSAKEQEQKEEEGENKDVEMKKEHPEDESESDASDNENEPEMDEKLIEKKISIPEGDKGSEESESDGEREHTDKPEQKDIDKEEAKECDDSCEMEEEKEGESENAMEDSEGEEESRLLSIAEKTSEKTPSDGGRDSNDSSGDSSSDRMEIDIKREEETNRDDEEEQQQIKAPSQPPAPAAPPVPSPPTAPALPSEKETESPKQQVIKEEVDSMEAFERRESTMQEEEKTEKETEREREREKAGADEEAARSSLFDAVQLMKTMGTIAITRLDGKSLGSDRTNGDSITLTRKDVPRAEENSGCSGEEEKRGSTEEAAKNCSKIVSSTESKNMEKHISSLGCSVSVTKAVDRDKDKTKDKDKDREKDKEKEKVKMPSGVDTTRLSPSISIIPMSGATERQKPKTTTAPSSPDGPIASTAPATQHPRDTSPATASHSLPQSSPSAQVAPRVSSSSNNSPQTSGASLPPPPPLSHPQAPPSSSVGSRGVFGPPPPGSINMGGGRGPIMTTPGMRMPGGVAGMGMMVAARMPAGPPPRHLPPEAGPLSAQLHKHSQKLAEVMRATLEDILGGLVMTGTPEARLAALQLELERTNWRHQQEVAEVRHNADVMLVEMRANLEAEKQRAVDEAKRQMEAQMMEGRRQMEAQMMERLAEVRRQMEAEKQRAVEETKRKQWCANCGKEALFFCCWNTSYCDYPCQQSHWPQHMSVCGQNSDGGAGGDGGPDSINGEASAHSSRVSTPVQNLVATQQYVEDDGVAAMAEEHRRRKMREDDAGSLTSSILAQCLIKGNRDRPKKKVKSSSSFKSSLAKDKDKDKDKERDPLVVVPPKAPKSPKAWMEWFLEQSGAEGIKENLQVTPKAAKAKARKSCPKQPAEGPRKKRKSTPCVRRKIEHILTPEEVTADMLDRVATKPKEKTHDQEHGTSCHQCRQKTSDTKTICRSGRCVGLRGFFCGPCLRTRYGEDARKALLDSTWSCPVCRGICNCSLCRKAFGQQAVGQIVQRLGKLGYSSVQQYLDSTGVKQEQPDPSDKPMDTHIRPEEDEEEEEEEESHRFTVPKVERLEPEEEEECAMDT